MYELEAPIYFYLFAIIPLMVVVFFVTFIWKKRTQKKFADLNLLQKIAPNYSVFKAVLKLAVLCLGLAFLILSLVNPKMGTKLKTLKREGVDIVFALDVSKSMLAEDIAPNRLEKSKQIISKIIDNLGSDRVGVIVYAGNAYPLLPITTDHAASKMFLQNANPDMVSSQGTAINEALDLAKTYYNNDEQTNRFLVIISDGEDHEKKHHFGRSRTFQRRSTGVYSRRRERKRKSNTFACKWEFKWLQKRQTRRGCDYTKTSKCFESYCREHRWFVCRWK